MKIVFGPRQPNEKETSLLEKIGFDLSSLKLKGRYYFLSLPESPRIQYKEHKSAYDLIHASVTYNGVEVISINQKTAIYNSYVYFTIKASAIETALSKNSEITEEEMAKVNAEPEFTPFQSKLASRLKQLEYIIFEGGAERGYGRMISTQFPYLLELKKENPEEHDKFIKSNKRYKQLFEMFPNWTDSKGIQRRYESIDAGLFMALSSGSRDGSNECSIM